MYRQQDMLEDDRRSAEQAPKGDKKGGFYGGTGGNSGTPAQNEKDGMPKNTIETNLNLQHAVSAVSAVSNGRAAS